MAFPFEGRGEVPFPVAVPAGFRLAFDPVLRRGSRLSYANFAGPFDRSIYLPLIDQNGNALDCHADLSEFSSRQETSGPTVLSQNDDLLVGLARQGEPTRRDYFG
jgi:hypothetical protein